MSQGKTAKSFTKSEAESSIPQLAATNIAFCHEFQVEGNVIPFDALVPSEDWQNSGRTNPSSSEILGANLQIYKSNIAVVSSQSGLIQASQYQVTNAQIKLNFSAQPFESFEVQVLGLLKLGNNLIDVRNLHIAKILPNGTTDFPIGRAFEIEPQQIHVFRDGLLMTRDTVNGDGSGNYEMLDPDENGFSSVVRFNTAASGSATGPSIIDNSTTTGEVVIVTSIGGIADNPSVSAFQEIESMNGRVQKLIDVVVDLASEEGDGIDETFFNGPATTVDLISFAQRVLTLETEIAKKNRFQEKILSTNPASGDVAELSFSNLTIGKWYEISGVVELTSLSGQNAVITYGDAASLAGAVYGNTQFEGNDGVNDRAAFSPSLKFKASSTGLFVNYNGAGALIGDGTKFRTFIQLEELNGGEPEETTDFT